MQPKPAHLGDAYAAQFSDAGIVAAYHHRPPYPAETFPMLAGLITTAPRTLLDVGCGTGDIARGLLPFVERIDAVDRSAPMIAAGRSLPSGGDPRLRWILGMVESADLSPPYALITAGESLHWMDWAVVLPRFAELLTPGGVLAMIGRQTTPEPWSAALGEIIPRYSTNREFQPYDLTEELTRRGLLTVQGTKTTSPVLFRQSVAGYVESFHSRNGFSRDRMMPGQAAGFDEELTHLVASFATDGLVELQVTGRIVYGLPHRAT
ncbi:MAG: trans-aconitate 2-methyltransferase [Dehalococcoidia bacterium]